MRQLSQHLHHNPEHASAVPETPGMVLTWARGYDLLLAALSLGRERTFRQRIVDMAHIGPGEAVLDVGCGTGTLALAAGRRVGATGRITGIDPSPQMIARARHKAERRALNSEFAIGVIEHLGFPDESFDVVLSTFMMHHLPDDLRARGLAEIARVLKPGGRLLVVDFMGPAGPWKSRLADVRALLERDGFQRLEMGTMRLAVVSGLGYVMGSTRER